MTKPTRMPDEVAILDFTCPVCRAAVGQACTGRAHTQKRGHMPRLDKWARAYRKAQLAVTHYLEDGIEEYRRLVGQTDALVDVEAEQAVWDLRRAGDLRGAVARMEQLLASELVGNPKDAP